jgi:hypothetical protein
MKINKSQFATQKDLFAYLCKNKQAIIDLKKSAIKTADAVSFIEDGNVGKAKSNSDYLYENDLEKGVLKRTIVANTYNWMDSHDDVHLDGVFTKSIKERAKRIPHLHDHKFELSAKVGNAISISEKQIEWKTLGVDLTGKTTVLLYESEILKEYNEKVYKEYLNDRIDQHSVGMRYINIKLAINDKDYKEEFATWKNYIDKIGNKEYTEKQGFFFAVSEAALLEVSSVLLGSNELTPTLNQPSVDTDKHLPEFPQIDKEELINYYKSILNSNN